MKTTFFRIINAAAIAALICAGCGGDDGTQPKIWETREILDIISGNGIAPNTAYTLTVNVSPQEGGTVSRNPDASSYKAGKSVTITAIPKNGYEFIGWSGASNSNEPSVTITMDDVKTLTAGFQKIGANLPKYTVYFNPNDAAGTPPETIQRDSGSVITLPGQAGMIQNGRTFDGWNENKNGGGTHYDANSPYTITRTATLFAQWTRNTYTLTVNETTGGNTTRYPNQTTYNAGTDVVVTAAAADGYTFIGWSGASSSKEPIVTITMNDDKTLTPIFGKEGATRFTVYFNVNDANNGNTPQELTADSGKTISLPNQGTLEKNGHNFDGWNTKKDGTGTTYPANYNYPVTGNITLYAKWTPVTTYTLTISRNPTNGGTTNPASSQANITAGQQISISATPATGYTFNGWTISGNGTIADTDDVNTAVTVNGNVTVRANFTQQTTTLTTYTLTVNRNPTNGGTTDPASSQSNITAGTQVDISATAATGYTFTNWTITSGNGNIANVNDANTTVTVNGNVTVRANFTQQTTTPTTYKVTVSSSGTGAVGDGTYAVGATVSINAGTAPAGQQFKNWTTASSGVTFYNANSATTTFTMPSNAVTVTAVFELLPNNKCGVDGTAGSCNTVNIGGQVWMTENLNYQPSTGNSWCYDGNADNCAKYGRLYDWNTANAVCPNGWHLPTSNEWSDLVAAAGGWGTAGKALKSTSGWNDYNGQSGNGTDNWGFSALPGGRFSYGDFRDAGNIGDWWAAGGHSDNAPFWSMHYQSNDVSVTSTVNDNGFSVRCVQGYAATIYTLTVSRNPTNGGNTTPASSQPYIAAGTQVGISANPANGYKFDGWTISGSGTIYLLGSYGIWWTATEYSSDNAYVRGMGYNNDDVGEYYISKNYGFSVRCVKNE